MQIDDEKIKYFGRRVDDLIRGKSLTRTEANALFRQILNNEQPDLHQGAFLAAITAKGATPQEIAGIWEAIYEIDTVQVHPEVNGPLVENCGTGMDDIKTFNISTASSIIAAAAGIKMAKHGSRAISSKCGAVDILETLGVDVECDAAIVKRSIEKAGIGIFNGMSGKVHPRALYRILSQIRFGTILNIAGSLANPALPAYGVRGVYSPEMVLPIARAMKEIGYKRALVFHGRSQDGMRGMDELSSLGLSCGAELNEDGEIQEFEVKPEDLGLSSGDEQAILSRRDREEEAIKLLKVLCGVDTGARRDIVCLNAAPIFCITGMAGDMIEGFARAAEIIDQERAVKLLQSWVAQQNSKPCERLERLQEMMERAMA